MTKYVQPSTRKSQSNWCQRISAKYLRLSQNNALKLKWNYYKCISVESCTCVGWQLEVEHSILCVLNGVGEGCLVSKSKQIGLKICIFSKWRGLVFVTFPLHRGLVLATNQNEPDF
jgi:hypothetical protein